MENTKKQNVTEDFKMIGDWTHQSKKLKSQFSQLTDADLKFEKGKVNDLLRRVQTRLQKNREDVIDIIKKVQPVISL